MGNLRAIKTLEEFSNYLSNEGIATVYNINLNEDGEYIFTCVSNRFNMKFCLMYQKLYSTRGDVAFIYEGEYFMDEKTFTQSIIKIVMNYINYMC